MLRNKMDRGCVRKLKISDTGTRLLETIKQSAKIFIVAATHNIIIL